MDFFCQLSEIVLAGSVRLPGDRIINSETHQIRFEPDRLVVRDLALLLADPSRNCVRQVNLEVEKEKSQKIM
jgi:hypothetical protein